MVAAIVHQLTRNLSMEEIEKSGFAPYYTDHTIGICAPIKFLREREIVHFQRFGEALRITQDKLDSKNFYAFNPGFDMCQNCDDAPQTRSGNSGCCNN